MIINSKIILKLFIISTIIYSHVICQSNINQAVIEYSFKNNGKVAENYSLKMFYNNGIVSYKMIGKVTDTKEQQFLDLNNKKTIQLLTIDKNEKYIYSKPFSDYEQGEVTDESESILGYKCKKAIFEIKSNTIEVWFTDELDIKGTPYISVAPGLGLVLKVIRNNDYEVYARNIEFRNLTEEEKDYTFENSKEVDDKIYLRKLIDSRYQTIQVFNHEQINFGDTINNPSEELNNYTYRYSKGTVLLKKIRLPKIYDGSTVIAEINSWSNGDAYDRTGSLFIIPTNNKINFLDAFKHGIEKLPIYFDKNGSEFQGVVCNNNYEPPLELIRFFTPFGVGGFNNYTKIDGYNWADSAKYSQEITKIIPHNGEDVWVGIFIGNYDKGGHKVSVKLKIHPPFQKSETINKVWIKPIFNTLNIMEMSDQNYGTMFHNDSLKVTVEIPEGIESLSLRYTSTGHGGWGGGDEFNPKVNEILIEDELIYKFIPWRDDCATYRLLNPSSGNFGNGLTSSDLSRSNWCPGSVTIPEIIKLNNISPGLHTFKIAIPIGEKEGGSFSAWNISGTLIGEYKNTDDK